jgi:hypothetical protein
LIAHPPLLFKVFKEGSVARSLHSNIHAPTPLEIHFQQAAAVRNIATSGLQAERLPRTPPALLDTTGNAETVLERPGDSERPQAAAGNQQSVGLRCLCENFVSKRDDIGFTFAAGHTESRQTNPSRASTLKPSPCRKVLSR